MSYILTTPATGVKRIPHSDPRRYVDRLSYRVKQWSYEHGQAKAFSCAARKLNKRYGFAADPSRRDMSLYFACIERLRFQTGL